MTPPTPPLLELRNLHKTVQDAQGTLTLLNNIHLIIHQGETVAIVGASGSGKSTLLSIMAGLDRPSQGDVLIDGEIWSNLNEDERAIRRGACMGFVFQSFQLLPHLTALENVMLPLEIQGNPNALPLAKALLEQVGLGQRLRHLPKHLSGGEQQRVALARAFVVRPRLLLADEPTGSLDHASGQMVMDAMFELNQAMQTTLILVTHDRSLAARCQRRITLSHGQIT